MDVLILYTKEGLFMGNEFSWTHFEVAFFIELYLEISTKKTEEAQGILKLSQLLTNLQKVADCTFPEEYATQSYIVSHLKIIKSIIEASSDGSDLATEEEIEITDLYFDAPSEFSELLALAKSRVDVSTDVEEEGQNSSTTKEAFRDWLLTEKGIAKNTSNCYLSALNSVDNYRSEKKSSSHSIFDLQNWLTTLKEIEILLIDKEFSELDIEKHRQWSSSIKKYAEFLSIYEDTTSQSLESDLNVSSELSEKIIKILDKSFPNGIYSDSIISQNKLRREFQDFFPNESIPNDLDLETFISQNGVLYNNVWYVVPEEYKTILKEQIQSQVNYGHQIFFYESILDKHKEMLNSIHIYSAEVLSLQLKRFFPNCFFYKRYFTVKKDYKIEKDLQKCLAHSNVVAFDTMKEKLQYVPSQIIAQNLSKNTDFIHVDTGIYTHIDRISLHPTEAREGKKTVEKQIAENGFASITSIAVDKSLKFNLDLTESAIREAIFFKKLSLDYEKRGNIITLKGQALNTEAVFRDFCLSRNEVSEEELQDYEEEITNNRGTRCLAVAYDTMIRVRKETFISKNEIMFPLEKVDSALELFVKDKTVALKSITSFTGFPHVEGASWNLYLLESYCMHYSPKFQFIWNGVNSKNIGIICPRTLGAIPYLDALAVIIENSGVTLVEKDVGDYLVKHHLLARRTAAQINDVILKAQAKSNLNQGG